MTAIIDNIIYEAIVLHETAVKSLAQIYLTMKILVVRLNPWLEFEIVFHKGIKLDAGTWSGCCILYLHSGTNELYLLDYLML